MGLDNNAGMGKNRLSEESSLYLRQHAYQPVDWWPWCDEAFELAEKEGKPVLISIGYSSCHWCHVMAHECFDDDYIANMMNRMFVNIKVDREERPDVDQIYMEAVQMLNQQGGWPLNVFCFPDKTPFMGGTYFPAEDQGQGIIPWPHLLVRIAESYKVDRDQLRENADAIKNNLLYLSDSILEDERAWEDSILVDGAKTLCANLDVKYGGFGEAPKFPPSQILGFLYAVDVSGLAANDEGLTLTQDVEKSLEICSHALIRGGLYDHVGGGFFRYAVDAQWRVPHFEKMLYDNALIVECLSKLWSKTRWEGLTFSVERTIDGLIRDFEVEYTCIFASSIDADNDEGEGAYYLWSESQIEDSLSSQYSRDFCDSFSIHGKDALNLYPWGIEDGKYEQFRVLLDDLLEIRQRRQKPVRDDKMILSWNALLIRALCVAGQVFDRRDWFVVAKKLLDSIWNQFKMRSDGMGFSSVFYQSGKVEREAFLDDYVNFALANIHFGAIADSFEVELSDKYLWRAKEITDHVIQTFIDVKGEGFFYCSEKAAKDLIVRKKEWFDNALPCGNSSLVHLLGYLDACYPSAVYRELLAEFRMSYIEKARRIPNGVAYALEGLAWVSSGIVLIKVGLKVDVGSVLSRLRDIPWRPFMIKSDSSMQADQLQLCRNNQCYPETQNIEDIICLLER